MLSFGHPIFLIGLAVLGVPVFLHLMNREIPVRLVFPSIRFIRKAHLPREGRQSLQDILVLLLRLLLLSAAVLVFARPRWRSRADLAASLGGDQAETVIVADVSASMQGWSGIEGLRERVAELAESAKRERVGLVLSANGVVATVAPGAGRAKLAEAISGMETAPVAGNHLPALREAARLFRSETQRTLVVVSDFQQSDWQFPTPPKLPPDIRIRLVDVNRARPENVGVTGAVVVPLAKDSLRIIAEVRNFGNAPAARKVALRAGDKTFTEEMTVPPRQIRKAVFVVPKPDASQAEITLDPDPYRADDSYRLWVGRFPAVKLLAVVPLTQEPQKKNELFFLKKVLGVRDESSPVTFDLQMVEAEHFFALTLDRIDGVFLLGAAGYFREPEFKLLKTYLEGGGVVICTSGEATAHQFRGLRQSDLLPVDFLGMAGSPDRRGEVFGLGWVNPGSILSELFADAEATDLFLFPIYRYARLRPTGAVQVLLKTLDNDPFLVEHGVGNGRLFASAIAFHPGWSDLPVTGSFLPLVRELLTSAVPDDFGVQRLECGAPIPVPRDLLGSDEALARQAEGQSTSAPGVFVLGDVPYEVNVSRRESVLETVNLFDLKAQLADGGQQAVAGAAELGPDGLPPESVTDLWPLCALAAALLALAEMMLVGFLDRRELAGRGAA